MRVCLLQVFRRSISNAKKEARKGFNYPNTCILGVVWKHMSFESRLLPVSEVFGCTSLVGGIGACMSCSTGGGSPICIGEGFFLQAKPWTSALPTALWKVQNIHFFTGGIFQLIMRCLNLWLRLRWQPGVQLRSSST